MADQSVESTLTTATMDATNQAEADNQAKENGALITDPVSKPAVSIWATKRFDAPPFPPLPTHKDLPAEDGTFVKNFQEHPQSILLTDSIWPVLQRRHPDAQFTIGQDSGIYWRITDPPLRGAISPDWYYVPNVPPLLDGEMRRSYVMWEEYLAPLLIVEFVSESEGHERDRTPRAGKFWIYERVIKPAFYVIYEAAIAGVEVYHLVEDAFVPVLPNERNHYPIAQLGIEVGIWDGFYKNVQLPWLRIWDAEGNLLPTNEERADQNEQRANQEAQRATRLAERLRALGIDPDEDEA